MAKKTRMGRNLNALLGGATRTRPAESDSAATDVKPASVSQSGSEPVATPVSREVSSQASNGASTAKQTETSVEGGTTQQKVSGETESGALDSAASVAPTPAKPSAPSDSLNNSAALNPTTPVGDKVELPAADLHPTDRLRMLGVDQITRGTYQPRRHFDQELLQELADSIKAQGLIQPILVRAYGGKFELIAGERRWRASQLAGISDIPAIVRDMDDQSVAAVSLIENIQRADLNPLEEAQALERLCEEFSMTHQQVAEAVGRSRVAVTNLMRLLELHEDVKSMVDNGELDMGHARALLGAPRGEQPVIAKRITQQGLTVRAVEKLVKDLREGKSAAAAEPTKSDPNIDALGQKLSKLLGAPVSIRHQKSGSGKLEINYSSIDELEGILSHIK